MSNEIKNLPKVFHHIGNQENHENPDRVEELTQIEDKPVPSLGVITNTLHPVPAVPMPYPSIMDEYNRAAAIATAGVNFKQAQSLNEKRQSNMLDLEKTALQNQSELWFMEQKFILEQKYRGGISNSYSVGGYAGDENFGAMPLNIPSLLEGFRNKYHIVKERLNGSLEWRYLIREVDGLRHIPCDEKELNEFFLDFIEETAGNLELNKAESKSLFEKLKRRYIPKVDKSDLELIPDSSLVFKNGILDICTNSFSPSVPARRFNRFAMEFNYPLENKEPVAFDALLDDIFGDNADWKHLCYQIIGALLAPVATLKRIYVFQGVSNAGKTRLSNIIMRMLDELEITECNTLSDITTDKENQLRHTRLVYIKEAANRKISSKQIVYLKGYADGGRSVNRATFKILVGTNYKLTTGEADELEPALRNRFITLPFPNVMKNDDERVASFEDVFFEIEKPYIARKALEAFSEVLRDDGKFCCDPEINRYIDLGVNDISGGESPTKQDAMSTVEQYFDVGDTLNLQLSGQEILERLKEADPANFREMSPASLSRMLNDGLKGKLMSKRIKNVTRYNLFFKEK